MFGDTMLANGTVYPQVEVQARRYRFRILNACNARFLNLQLLKVAKTDPDVSIDGNGIATNAAGPNWLVLGTEAGFLENPVIVPGKKAITFDSGTGNVVDYSLLTGNAERWDVIVDFTGFADSDVILYSDSPAPFPGGDPRNDYYLGNLANPVVPAAGSGPDTRQIMRFKVVPVPVTETPDAPLTLVTDPNINDAVNVPTVDSWNPAIAARLFEQDYGIDPFLANIGTGGNYTLNPSHPDAPLTVTKTRVLTLNEEFDAYGRLTQFLGTDAPGPSGKLGRHYADNAPTETPSSGDLEIWEILNLTGDTHPIHFHLVNVQILNRQPINVAGYTGGAYSTAGDAVSPDPSERGWKETVRMNPGEVTRVIMKFDLGPTKITGPAHNPIDFSGVSNGFGQFGGLGTPPPSPRTGGAEYVWHCHILEHEEHDMMRPLIVT